jgi:hypothetical protein
MNARANRPIAKYLSNVRTLFSGCAAHQIEARAAAGRKSLLSEIKRTVLSYGRFHRFVLFRSVSLSRIQKTITAGTKQSKLRFRRSGEALAREDDVFFRPVMNLPAMRASQSGTLKFGHGPQGFFDGLAGGREFAGGRTSDEDPFNHRTFWFLQRSR